MRVSTFAAAMLAPLALAAYQPCGFLATGGGCPEGYECISDPRVPGCGLACDGPAICVCEADTQCSGFAGTICAKGRTCHDLKDECDPKKGGRDCAGICLSDDKEEKRWVA